AQPRSALLDLSALFQQPTTRRAGAWSRDGARDCAASVLSVVADAVPRVRGRCAGGFRQGRCRRRTTAELSTRLFRNAAPPGLQLVLRRGRGGALFDALVLSRSRDPEMDMRRRTAHLLFAAAATIFGAVALYQGVR